MYNNRLGSGANMTGSLDLVCNSISLIQPDGTLQALTLGGTIAPVNNPNLTGNVAVNNNVSVDAEGDVFANSFNARHDITYNNTSSLTNTVAGINSSIATLSTLKANLQNANMTGTFKINNNVNVDTNGNATVNSLTSVNDIKYNNNTSLMGTITAINSDIDTVTASISNVNNTSDINKPISSACQNALNLLAPIVNPTFTKNISVLSNLNVSGNATFRNDITYNNGQSLVADVANMNDSFISLSNLKANVHNALMTGTFKINNNVDVDSLGNMSVNKLTSANDLIYNNSTSLVNTVTSINSAISGIQGSISNVNNTSDINKPISTSCQNALNLLAPIVNPTFTKNISVLSNLNVSGNATFYNDISYNKGQSLIANVANMNDSVGSLSSVKANVHNAVMTGTFSVNGLVNVDGTGSLLANQLTSLNDILYDNGKSLKTVVTNINSGIASAVTTSESYTDTQIANLVSSAPQTLNTLNEIATALGNDPNFSTSMVNLIGTKAPIINPTFTNNLNVLGAVTGNSICSVNDILYNNGSSLITNVGNANTLIFALANNKANIENPTFIADATILSNLYVSGKTTFKNASTMMSSLNVVGDITNVGNASCNNLNVNGTINNTALNNFLATKASLASPTFTGTVGGITSTMVGLGNCNNTSDASKPISTATQAALNLLAPIASPTFTGTVNGITSAMVGLGNCQNTSDTNKPVSLATQTLLNLKAPLLNPTFTGTVIAPDITLPSGSLNAQLSNIVSIPPKLLALNDVFVRVSEDYNLIPTDTITWSNTAGASYVNTFSYTTSALRQQTLSFTNTTGQLTYTFNNLYPAVSSVFQFAAYSGTTNKFRVAIRCGTSGYDNVFTLTDKLTYYKITILSPFSSTYTIYLGGSAIGLSPAQTIGSVNTSDWSCFLDPVQTQMDGNLQLMNGTVQANDFLYGPNATSLSTSLNALTPTSLTVAGPTILNSTTINAVLNTTGVIASGGVVAGILQVGDAGNQFGQKMAIDTGGNIYTDANIYASNIQCSGTITNTDLTNRLALKAPLASPTFTGNVTAGNMSCGWLSTAGNLTTTGTISATGAIQAGGDIKFDTTTSLRTSLYNITSLRTSGSATVGTTLQTIYNVVLGTRGFITVVVANSMFMGFFEWTAVTTYCSLTKLAESGNAVQGVLNTNATTSAGIVTLTVQQSPSNNGQIYAKLASGSATVTWFISLL
jgi:hypothetical protein